MTGEDATSSEHAFCPHCGAPLAAWAKFCPKCGNAVDASPEADLGGDGPAGERSKTASRYREAFITIGVLVVAALIVGAVALSRGLPFGTAQPQVPPAGEIWFGDSYDPGTFEIHARWTATDVGRKLSGVAHASMAVAAGQAKLHIDLDGTTIADQTLDNLSGPGELIGFTFTPPAAGTYAFSIVGTDGAVLAQGSIPAQ